MLLCLQGDTAVEDRRDAEQDGEPSSQGSGAGEGRGGRARGRGWCVAAAWFRATGLRGPGWTLALISGQVLTSGASCRPPPPTGTGPHGLPEPLPRGGLDGRARPKLGPRMTPCPPPGAPQVLAAVQRQVPGAQLVKELPHELVLTLPYGGALDGSFAKLFRELDQRLEELGLAGYGISDTSLEEVRLGEGCLEEVVRERGGVCLSTAGWPGRMGGPGGWAVGA